MSEQVKHKNRNHKTYNAAKTEKLSKKTGCLKDLQGFLETEGCTENEILRDCPQILVIGLDEVKKLHHKQERIKSCDMGFMTNNNQFQLVECKYRIINPENLRDKDIADKVTDSRKLMVSYDITNFTTQSVFLFHSNYTARAIAKINRLYPIRKGNKEQVYKAMNTKDFLSTYF